MNEATQTARGLPRRTQLLILAAAAFLAVFVLFVAPSIAQLFKAKPPLAAPAPAPGTFTATDEQWATLKFAVVQPTDFRAESVTDGKIATDDERTTQVFSPFTGHVTRVIAKVGDHVRAGQPLFAVQAAEFVQGQNDLAVAAAQVKLTQAAEARQHELYKSSGAALKDWQQSQSDFAAAQAALSAVRNRLRILGKTDAEIALMEQSASGKGETLVTAPIAGVVTARAVSPGQNITSVSNGGANPAFVISDLSTVWVVGNLREADSASAHVGETVQVRVNAVPSRTFTARVDFVSPTVDPVTRRVTVRGAISNPDGLLKPEMFATVSLFTDAGNVSPSAPDAAVIYEGDTARVWVARAGHALELRQIKTGAVRDGVVEVLSGLQPGEKVVTSGSLFIDRAAQGD